MSTANPLTHFPISTFPTKFNPLTSSRSLSVSFRHCYPSANFSLSRDFLPGKSPIFGRRGLMTERVIKISSLGSGDGEEDVRVLEQEAFVDGSSQFPPNFVSTDFEATINRLSKWLISVLFGAVLLWRHDAEALWVAMGSVINSVFSYALKRVLNQERPVNLRSDPGMPSSHAQSIFFAVVFIILSMVEWLGVNEITLIFAAVSLAFGSYLAWLRVAQRLHTTNQVVVGGVLGSCFALLWLWSWDALVFDAFNSFVWVRICVVLGSAICCLGFLLYVILNWFTDEQ